MTPKRIHIFGASGSGTTTLGRALAAELGLTHLDSDDFYWEPTDPPYNRSRPVPERQHRLATAFAVAPEGWSLSGWLGGWGDSFLTQFQAVIFLSLPPMQRLARLQQREIQHFGPAILPGGRLHDAHHDFLAWAAGYDSNSTSRNRAQQEAWLTALPCPVLRLDNSAPTETTTASALDWLRALSG